MNYSIIYDHVKNTISEDSDQFPNLRAEDIEEIITNLMLVVKSVDKLDRLTIRRTCWDSFKDSNTRQIIDLCFPSQLGPLAKWPASYNNTKSAQTSSSGQNLVKPLDDIRDIPSKEKGMKAADSALDIQEISNKEIMIKLKSLEDKIDRISGILEQIFMYTNNEKNN